MSLPVLKKEKANLSRIQKEQQKVSNELEPLMKIPEVVRCLELIEIKNENNKRIKDISDKIFWLNVEMCNHLMVYIGSDYDGYEGRSYPKYFCLKCGLTNAYEDLGSFSTYGDYYSKMNDMWRKYGYYSIRGHLIPINVLRCDGVIEVNKIKRICDEAIQKNPKITNGELQSLLVEKTKEKIKK